ncbi:MAG TPA: hypothetical protein VN858_10180 [Casimicrobiaceae bacterium]|nr:hypothetical protein [Casimicrobiaceae bacterium]
MQTTIRALIGAALVVTAFGVAVAKLPPAPPMTDQQKAEKATKDKAKADAEKAQLTKAEDKAIANYESNMKAKGKTVHVNMSAGEGGQASSAKGLPAQPEKASNAHSPPKK